MKKTTIGLFGTCGGSRWRDKFMSVYSWKDIEYYNPQVENWTPECAVEEAEHLVNDEILLFPVTNETYATGSLAESGFSILSAIRANSHRYVVVFIDPSLDEGLRHDAIAAKESIRARALVNAHLKKLDHDNVFVVDSLDDMLALSLDLHLALTTLKRACEKYVRSGS